MSEDRGGGWSVATAGTTGAGRVKARLSLQPSEGALCPALVNTSASRTRRGYSSGTSSDWAF